MQFNTKSNQHKLHGTKYIKIIELILFHISSVIYISGTFQLINKSVVYKWLKD